MNRSVILAGAAILGLALATAPASAAAPSPAARRLSPAVGGGEVTAISILPTAGKAEVVIAVGGDVDIQDFALPTPPRVVLDLKGARLTMPPRGYDRVTRGGVSNIRVSQYKDDVVRVVIDLDGEHDYTVTRGDHSIRVAIGGGAATFTAWNAGASAPAANAAVAQAEPAAQSSVQPTVQPTPAAQPRAARPAPRPAVARITVTYNDADIHDVLAAFAAFSGRTIIVGKGVTGNVTAEVRDQPWDVALKSILRSQGLAAQEDATGIIAVDSWANIASQRALEPVTTQIVPVNYARAASLVEAVKPLLSKECLSGDKTAGGDATNATAAQGNCVVRGSITADTATNRLVITDVPARLGEIMTYIKDLDIRTPQVAIKSKIIFVNRTNIEDLGLSYDLGGKGQFFNKLVQRNDPTTFKPVDTNGDGVPDALGGGTAYEPSTNIIDLGGNALSAIANANQRVVNPALQLVFSAAIGKFDLTSFLDALQEVRLADIQAEPSIVTLDNREASILVGEETPIRVLDAGTASGAAGAQPRATVNFKETGIILRVTPHITNNRQILMTLHSERSNLQAAASDLGYTFQKQAADNQLLVGDGETAVIGGLTVTEVTVSKAGIPILVDLPLIGRLFGQTRKVEEKRDLLILVTPHIVDEGDQLGRPRDNR